MNHRPMPNIRIKVDPANPGQFFACCGLLELADRLWDGAEGWFEGGMFCIETEDKAVALSELLSKAQSIRLSDSDSGSASDDEDDDDDSIEVDRESPPFIITAPISLRLDWWNDKSLKTWAGSMNERKIFLAMCNAIDPQNNDPLNQKRVVFDADTTASKVARHKRSNKPREPFYFDARRGASAWSIDVGFSTDSLKKKKIANTVAYPVVEAMCLIGLQRFRPKPTNEPRIFDYYAWKTSFPVEVAPIAVSGLIGDGVGYSFKNSFRTDQKKHKAFNPANPIKRR